MAPATRCSRASRNPIGSTPSVAPIAPLQRVEFGDNLLGEHPSCCVLLFPPPTLRGPSFTMEGTVGQDRGNVSVKRNISELLSGFNGPEMVPAKAPARTSSAQLVGRVIRKLFNDGKYYRVRSGTSLLPNRPRFKLAALRRHRGSKRCSHMCARGLQPRLSGW